MRVGVAIRSLLYGRQLTRKYAYVYLPLFLCPVVLKSYISLKGRLQSAVRDFGGRTVDCPELSRTVLISHAVDPTPRAAAHGPGTALAAL